MQSQDQKNFKKTPKSKDFWRGEDSDSPKGKDFLPGEGSVAPEALLWLESEERRRSRFRFPGSVSLSTSGWRFDISFSNSLKEEHNMS